MTTLDLGLTAADVADTSDDWYTPRWLFDAAGLVFDIDVCAPVDPTRRTCPARRYYTPIDDGLVQPWEGLVWMNPPYSNTAPWVEKWCAHGNGLLLVPPARSRWWAGLLAQADALTLLELKFLHPERVGTYRWMTAMASMGSEATAALARVGPAFTRSLG